MWTEADQQREGRMAKHSPMTAGKLHRILGELIKAGHERSAVCIDKETFTHPLESDGCVMLDAYGAKAEYVPVMNDDGGMMHGDKEKHKSCVVLWGFETHPGGVNRAANVRRARKKKGKA